MNEDARQSIPRPLPLPKLIPTQLDYELRRKLDNFRCTKMQERHGAAIARNLGPVDIMSDAILERIAACARFKKILTVEDLRREVPKWWSVQEYGEQVIEIVHRYVHIFNTCIFVQVQH